MAAAATALFIVPAISLGVLKIAKSFGNPDSAEKSTSLEIQPPAPVAPASPRYEPPASPQEKEEDPGKQQSYESEIFSLKSLYNQDEVPYNTEYNYTESRQQNYFDSEFDVYQKPTNWFPEQRCIGKETLHAQSAVEYGPRGEMRHSAPINYDARSVSRHVYNEDYSRESRNIEQFDCSVGATRQSRHGRIESDDNQNNLRPSMITLNPVYGALENRQANIQNIPGNDMRFQKMNQNSVDPFANRKGSLQPRISMTVEAEESIKDTRNGALKSRTINRTGMNAQKKRSSINKTKRVNLKQKGRKRVHAVQRIFDKRKTLLTRSKTQKSKRVENLPARESNAQALYKKESRPKLKNPQRMRQNINSKWRKPYVAQEKLPKRIEEPATKKKKKFVLKQSLPVVGPQRKNPTRANTLSRQPVTLE